MFDKLYRTIRVLVKSELDSWVIYYLELVRHKMTPSTTKDGELWMEASLANLYKLFSWLASDRTVRRRLAHMVKSGQILTTKDPYGGPNLYRTSPSMALRIDGGMKWNEHLLPAQSTWREGQPVPGGRDNLSLDGLDQREGQPVPGGEGQPVPGGSKTGQKTGSDGPYEAYTHIPLKKEPDKEPEGISWDAIRDEWNATLEPLGYKPLRITSKFKRDYLARSQDQGFSWPELVGYLATHILDPTLYGQGFNPERTFLRAGWYLETKADGYHNWERAMDSKYHRPATPLEAQSGTGHTFDPFGWEDRPELDASSIGHGGYTIREMMEAIKVLDLEPEIMKQLEERVKRAGWNAKTLRAVGLEVKDGQ